MLEFVIHNIFGFFYEHAFQQTVVIPMCTNCAPFPVDLLLYPYGTDFIQGLLKKKQQPVRFLYIPVDDVFSLNNCKFGYFVDHIYPIEFEIKDTTYADRSVAYLDIHLDIDSEGRIRTNLHDKDYLHVSNVNFQLYM